MPRKYRPPAARRRKSKRQTPYYVEPLPGEVGATAAQDGAGPAAPEDLEAEPDTAVVTPEPAPVAPRASERTATAGTKHIARDYSYVRAEIRRIALVAGFLIVSLIVTALLRN